MRLFLFSIIILFVFVSANFTFGESSVVDYDYLHSMLDESKYKDALEYLEELSMDNPNNMDILFYQGYIHDETGKYSEALNYYDQVLWYEPNDLETLYNKAITLENIGEYEEAIIHYNKVLRLDPNDVDSLLSKGILLYDLERLDESLVQFQNVLDVNPENSEAQSYLEKIKQLKSNPAVDLTIIFAVSILSGIVLSLLFYVKWKKNREKTLPYVPKLWNVQIDKTKYQRILWTGLIIGASGFGFWQYGDSLSADVPRYDASFRDLMEPDESIQRQIAWKIDLVKIRFDPEPIAGTMTLLIQDHDNNELFSEKFTGLFEDHIYPKPGMKYHVTLTNDGNTEVYPHGSIYPTGFDENGSLVLNSAGMGLIGFLLMVLGALICFAAIPVIFLLTVKKYKELKE